MAIDVASRIEEHVRLFVRAYPDFLSLRNQFFKDISSIKDTQPPEKAIVLSQVALRSRIKTAESFKKKLARKFLQDVSNVSREMEEVVEDVVGFRLIFPSKKGIFQILPQLVQGTSDFEVLRKEASTPLNEHARELEALGFKIKTRDNGYLGIHVIYALRHTDGLYRKVELQVRTYFQDAWEVYDHQVYKQFRLTDDQIKMKQLLAHQMENLADGFEYLRDKVASLKIANLPSLEEDSAETLDTLRFQAQVRANAGAALPASLAGELIKLDADPKIYLVTHDAKLRWVELADERIPLFLGERACKKVYTVSESDFIKFEVGHPIETEAAFVEQMMIYGKFRNG